MIVADFRVNKKVSKKTLGAQTDLCRCHSKRSQHENRKGNEAMRAISLGPFLEFGLDIQFHAKNRTAVNQTLTKEIEHTCRDFAFGRLNEAPKAEDNAGHEAQESRETCRHHSSSRFEGDERVGHVKLRLQPARRGEAAANHLDVSARHFVFFFLRR